MYCNNGPGKSPLRSFTGSFSKAGTSRLRVLVNCSYSVAQCTADQKALAKFGIMPNAFYHHLEDLTPANRGRAS